MHGCIVDEPCSRSHVADDEVTPDGRRRARMKSSYASLSAEKKNDKVAAVLKARSLRMTQLQVHASIENTGQPIACFA